MEADMYAQHVAAASAASGAGFRVILVLIALLLAIYYKKVLRALAAVATAGIVLTVGAGILALAHSMHG
jgi:uncharacterized membrane protein YdfJ with MMPL/SSD domain